MTDFSQLERLGMALIVSGASGTGKSTICRRLVADVEGLEFSVSCATRAPRAGEVDGQDYYFVSRDDFEERVRQGLFIEHAHVHDNYYGTLRTEVESRVKAGLDVLLDVDVQGAAMIREAAKQDALLATCAEFLFIAPPSFAELERRLRGRGTDAEEVIAKRLRNASGELAHWDRYDYLLVNDQLDTALEQANALVSTFRRKTSRLLPGDRP